MTQEKPLASTPEGTPKGRELAEQVLFVLEEMQQKKKEKQEPPKTSITREKYILDVCQQIAFYENQALQCHVKVAELKGTLGQLESLEDLRMVVHFYDEGDHLSYEVKEKPKVGFFKPEDAGYWNEEQKKKRNKKKG